MTRVLPALLLGAALAAGVAPSASAQPPQPGPAARKPVDTLTVTGKRRSDRDQIKTVIAPFVEAHAEPDRLSGLLLRQPASGICPVTLGMSAAFNDFVTRRIVQVANIVGAVVQTSGKCRHNVEVAFTTDPQRLVDTLARQTYGDILGPHFVGETKASSRDSRPIQAWYMSGTVADTGGSVAMIDIGDGKTSPGGEVELDDVYGRSPYSGLGSRIPPSNNSQFLNTLIVADLNQLEGREIGPVSDYIAMLALSQPQSLDGCGPLPSILDLLAPGCQERPKPQSLTDGDVAFLKALYAADVTRSGREASHRVERAMAKALAGPQLQAKPAAP